MPPPKRARFAPRRPIKDGPRRKLAEGAVPFAPHEAAPPKAPQPPTPQPAAAPPAAPRPATAKPATARPVAARPTTVRSAEASTRPTASRPPANRTAPVPKPTAAAADKPAPAANLAPSPKPNVVTRLHPPFTTPATPKPRPTPAPEPNPAGERLQKLLAQAGIASRRAAEQVILEGRVQVNGVTVTELGTRAHLGKDHIRVDGKLLQGPEPTRWFMLNKPRGYVTTLNDPQKRRTVADLLGETRGPHEKLPRLYPVGRLDYLSEGLLLMTNDGDLANALSKASSLVQKTYLVKVAGVPTPESIDQLRRGIMIDRGRLNEVRSGRRDRVVTAPAEIEQVRGGDNPWFQVTLIEGRNRQLRKMFEEVGHHVEKIRRIAYGALQLDVEPGAFRELTLGEVTALDRASKGRKVERKRELPEAAQLKKPVPPRSARKKPVRRRQPS